MANEELNIQIKDLSGNLLFPKTKGAVVINNAGQNLGGVEAGAQVNVLEGITVDGQAVTITNKIAAITLPVAAEYSMAKQATAETGYAATYYLTKDGVQVGEKINIAKDQVLDDVELKQCTVADQPIAGLEVGDWYFDFTFQNKSEHIYLAAKDLTDVYTAGDGLTLTNGEFAVNTTDTAIADAAPTANSTKFVQSGGVKTALDGKVDKLATKPTAGEYTKVTINAEGQVTAGTTLAAADIPALSLSKITDVTATAAEVNQLAGAGAVKADFQKLAAITADAAEINVLDGITATTAELNYVDGVTSNIQDQLDGKQATITGAATSIVSNDLTASMILASDANGKVAATAIPAATAFLTYEVLA